MPDSAATAADQWQRGSDDATINDDVDDDDDYDSDSEPSCCRRSHDGRYGTPSAGARWPARPRPQRVYSATD